jgi:hypothetical protein
MAPSPGKEKMTALTINCQCIAYKSRGCRVFLFSPTSLLETGSLCISPQQDSMPRRRPSSSSSASGPPSSPPARTGPVYWRVDRDHYRRYNPDSSTVYGDYVQASSLPPGTYVANMSPSTVAASSPITPGPSQPALLPVPNSPESVRSISEGFGSVGSASPPPLAQTGRLGAANLAFDPTDPDRQTVTAEQVQFTRNQGHLRSPTLPYTQVVPHPSRQGPSQPSAGTGIRSGAQTPSSQIQRSQPGPPPSLLPALPVTEDWRNPTQAVTRPARGNFVPPPSQPLPTPPSQSSANTATYPHRILPPPTGMPAGFTAVPTGRRQGPSGPAPSLLQGQRQTVQSGSGSSTQVPPKRAGQEEYVRELLKPENFSRSTQGQRHGWVQKFNATGVKTFPESSSEEEDDDDEEEGASPGDPMQTDSPSEDDTDDDN